MSRLKLIITIPEPYPQLLSAELAELEFDAFELFDHRLEAYIDLHLFRRGGSEAIREILNRWSVDYKLEEQQLPDINWNERWERTIQPTVAGPFLIKPTWADSEAESGQIILTIDPKMAFGTGIHATTRLMLLMLPGVITKGCHRVLDAGTGTGVLAIAAAKLGAEQVMAFDSDRWSEINAKENVILNGVKDLVEVKLGTIGSVPLDPPYNLILANINRNALLDLMPDMRSLLHPDGHLLLSGLLIEDKDSICSMARIEKLRLQDERQEGEWIALYFRPVTASDS